MAHRLLRDVEADGWERSDFPIICESCLGDNPYVRMTRAEYDKECKICTRPFTVFRWRPGRDARYKKTEICQTCCKIKNVCQVCLLDLEYGLPVQVRDTALQIDSNDSIPQSDVNREYFAEEHDRKARAGIDYESSYGKVRPNDTILKLQRTMPYYKRNRAHVCSFYMRGECTRGAECPYRHEMPEEGELSQQNIKDRYYGINDPVALKLLSKAGEMSSLEPPEDENVRTLYVGGVEPGKISEQDLRDQFYAFGEIESVKFVRERPIAFVTYTMREAAEKAAEELFNKLVVNGYRLKLMWGKPQVKGESDEGTVSASHSGLVPRAVVSQIQGPVPGDQNAGASYFNLPAVDTGYYPSMDPQRMGALIGSHDGAGPPPEVYPYHGMTPQYQSQVYSPYGWYSQSPYSGGLPPQHQSMPPQHQAIHPSQQAMPLPHYAMAPPQEVIPPVHYAMGPPKEVILPAHYAMVQPQEVIPPAQLAMPTQQVLTPQLQPTAAGDSDSTKASED